MGVVKWAEGFFDVSESELVLAEIDGVATLEIDLDEDEDFVVLTLDRLEESASTEHLLQHKIVRRRQVV